MSIIYWNVRGAASKAFLRNARELIRTHNPSIFVVAEPRISGDRADRQIANLGFPNSTKYDARGFSGGIWVLSDDSIGNVTVIGKRPQIITLLIEKHEEEPWILSAVYASPTSSVREELWIFIERCQMFDNIAWCLVGDFNQIMSSEERQDGRLRDRRHAQRMVNCLQSKGLMETNANFLEIL